MFYTSKGRLSLSDEVYNQMLVRISEGTWREGEKIPSESQLCIMYNVSRVSVRSALQKLQGNGLIETKQGIGSFICVPSYKNNIEEEIIAISSDITGQAFLEFFEFRQAVEFKAIELFVIRATEQDMLELEKALKGMDEYSDDYKKYTEFDFKFHLGVIKGSKNQFLYNAIMPYKDTFFHYLEEINRLADRSDGKKPGGHQEYFQALIDKKPSAAKKMLLADNSYYHIIFFNGQK